MEQLRTNLPLFLCTSHYCPRCTAPLTSIGSANHSTLSTSERIVQRAARARLCAVEAPVTRGATNAPFRILCLIIKLNRTVQHRSDLNVSYVITRTFSFVKPFSHTITCNTIPIILLRFLAVEANKTFALHFPCSSRRSSL